MRDTTRARVGLRASRQRRHLKLARKSSAGRVNGLELDFEPGLPNQSDELRAPPILASQRPRRGARDGSGIGVTPTERDVARPEPARPSAPRLDPHLPRGHHLTSQHLETSETVACGPGDMDAAAALSDALTAGRPVGIRAAAMSDDVDELARLLDAGVPVDYADGAPGTPSSPPWLTALPTRPRSSSRPGARWTPKTPPPAAASSTPPPAPRSLLLRPRPPLLPRRLRPHGRPRPRRSNPLEIAMRHRPRAPNSAAVSRGAYRVLVAILDAGASPDVPFSAGAHPLAVAVAAGARDVVELLLGARRVPRRRTAEWLRPRPRGRARLKTGGDGNRTDRRASVRTRARAVGDRPRGARRRDDAPWFDGGEDARGRRTERRPFSWLSRRGAPIW